MRSKLIPSVLWTGVILFPTGLLAQNAQLSGFVSDASEARVPKANLTITNDDTGAKRTTNSSSDGLYAFPTLEPGRYSVLIEAPGFQPERHTGIRLEVEQNARLDFTLKVGDARQEVTVQADAPLTNTTDASVSTVVDRGFVESMPLNGRTFQSLITLTPGVVTTATPIAGEQGQLSVAGQRSGSNYFILDGVSANFGAAVAQYQAQTSNGGLPAFSALGSTASLVSVDALQEFRLETSTYAPEFGRQSGAQVMLVTRSGTNTFHGTAFEYFRNDALDATDWFANSTGQPRPRERQNDFGGVLGGPIVKDKTFFFFSYEGLRVTQPLFQVVDVPSLAARAQAAPSVKPVVDAFPLPNGPATGPFLAELAASSPNRSSLDATSLRVDHAFNSKMTLFGRFNHSPSVLDGVYGTYPGSNPFKTTQEIDTGTLGAIAILTPTITNDFHFNYSRSHGRQNAYLSNFGGATVPLASSIYASFQTPETSNAFYATGDGRYVNLSNGRFGDNLNRQINITDSLSVAKGTHQLKFGFDFRRLTPIQGPPDGFASYFWLTTASMVSGATPDYLAILEDKSDIRQLYYNFSIFAQDTWKLSPRLTLTYGIRWDYNPPPTETNGAANAPYALSEITDLATATLLPRGSPLWHADWKNFAPRIGAAYQLRRSAARPLVLRAGFGQFFDLGTDPAGFLNNAEGWFPFSIAYTACVFGTGPDCNSSIPYTGPKPPFVFTKDEANTTRAFDPHLKLPYALEWNVALEQTLSPNQTIKISYLGSAGRRLLRDDLAANPNPLTEDLFTSINLTRNTAYSSYNALQLQFQRRLSNGLQALISYSWSHSLDINSSDVTYTTLNDNLPTTLYNVRQDYGDSDFDIRHSFSAALTYNIPSPPAQNSFLKTVLRDWSIDSITSARTGIPFNVLYTPATPGAFMDGQGDPYLLRPDRVPGQPVWINNSNVGGGKELNPAAFSIPSSLMQGSEGRNDIRGFPLLETDLGLRRQFNIGERYHLNFRVETFNFINHPNFANPNNQIGTCALGAPCTPVFGWGTSFAMLNQGLGFGNFHGTPLNALYQVGGPRSLQLSLRLQF